MEKVVRFHRLDAAAYAELTMASRVIEADSHGAKLIALDDSRYLKLFRRKRLLSSALMRPYAWRFYHNARRLAALGIPTVAPESLLRIPHLHSTAVLYRPLPGRTLRELLDAEAAPELLIGRLGSFLGTLHRQGVYFRSLHFGNLVVTEAGALGLIDVADLDFRSAPLREALVLRNLHHLLRYPTDWSHVRSAATAFRHGYAAAGRPLPESAATLLAGCARQQGC